MEGVLLRYGIIGVGMMGREHLYNLAAIPGALVVAVADPDPGSREQAVAVASALQLSRPAPPLQVFEDHGSLLDSRMCDIVVVATPNMTHAQILLDILNHPKAHHILVEKPLCTTVEDCYNVIEAAQARPEVLVQVGLEYRYIPAVAKLIEQVKINSVGRVRMVSIREHRFPFLVKVNNWNRFNKNSGGTLVEKCCHFFDLMTLIADSMPVRVMASGGQDVNHLDESYHGEVPDILDNAYVVVDYENGVRGMLDLCMFAEGSRNEQEICVVGTRGKGEAFVPESIVRLGARDSGREGVLTYEVHDKRVKYEGLHHGSSFLEHLEFAAAIKSNGERPPTVGLEEGLMSVAVGVAAQQSIELGRFVTLTEVIARKR
jgi:predicted dehydrogenase